MNVKGINFVKFGPDDHIMGIKREQFIDYLNSLEVDQNGWVNFKLTPLIQPIKGFSCKLVHMMPKDVYEAKKAEKNDISRRGDLGKNPINDEFAKYLLNKAAETAENELIFKGSTKNASR